MEPQIVTNIVGPGPSILDRQPGNRPSRRESSKKTIINVANFLARMSHGMAVYYIFCSEDGTQHADAF